MWIGGAVIGLGLVAVLSAIVGFGGGIVRSSAGATVVDAPSDRPYDHTPRGRSHVVLWLIGLAGSAGSLLMVFAHAAPSESQAAGA